MEVIFLLSRVLFGTSSVPMDVISDEDACRGDHAAVVESIQLVQDSGMPEMPEYGHQTVILLISAQHFHVSVSGYQHQRCAFLPHVVYGSIFIYIRQIHRHPPFLLYREVRECLSAYRVGFPYPVGISSVSGHIFRAQHEHECQIASCGMASYIYPVRISSVFFDMAEYIRHGFSGIVDIVRAFRLREEPVVDIGDSEALSAESFLEEFRAAFQSASGLVNLITPTAAVVMGGLAFGRVPYDRWVRFVWKLILIFLLLCLGFLAVSAVL